MKIMVLGAGLVGGAMAADLARDTEFRVTAADVDAQALGRLALRDERIERLQVDLSNPEEVTRLVSASDLVLSAVPGWMGYQTLEAVLRAGTSVVDIAFFAEDPFDLHSLAAETRATAVVDFGVAPGLSHLLVGHAHRLLDETDRVTIYVGGLPEQRSWPYEYKAVYSPADVIEIYTRPARYVENGALVTRPALSDPELIDFPGIGTLEAFNTDGLRTLMRTLDVPNMKEKTLRYPGHIEKVAMLRDTGFFDKEEVVVRGQSVRPIDVTSRLLFDQWKLEEGDVDLTVMRVEVEGQIESRRLRYRYDLLDRRCQETGVHSMARATGYTATVALRLLAAGLFEQRGVFAPEHLGLSSECVEFMLRGLEERGVRLVESVEELEE